MNMECDWLFCCDGDEMSGLGHVGRCLGYAEMLADVGYTCTFQGNYGFTALGMIESGGFKYISAPRLSTQPFDELALLHPGTGVILDSYDVNVQSISKLYNYLKKIPLVLIDDFALHSNYSCDALINFTIGATRLIYPEGDFQRYLGPDFYPARRWLRRLRESRSLQPHAGDIRRILIIAGGNDLCGINQAFLKLLLESGWSNCEVAVLISDDQADVTDLKRLLSGFSIGILLPRQPNLEDWLAWADACLCGGGLVKYECLYAGIPVASLAQNEGQANDSKFLAQQGLIADLGSGPGDLSLMLRFLTDREWRISMQKTGRNVVGGLSGQGGLKPFQSVLQ